MEANLGWYKWKLGSDFKVADLGLLQYMYILTFKYILKSYKRTS